MSISAIARHLLKKLDEFRIDFLHLFAGETDGGAQEVAAVVSVAAEFYRVLYPMGRDR